MTDQYDSIRISLVGVGYMIQKSKVNEALLARMFSVAAKLKSSLNDALLDAEFFPMLGVPELKSISDLEIEYSYFGLLDDPRSRIEIWKNGKRKTILKLMQLYNKELLFPLYDLKLEEVSALAIKEFEMIVTELSIGTVLDVTVRIPNFSIDNLQFKICEVRGLGNQKLLFDVLYEEKTLFVRIPETLITNFSVYFKA